MKKCSILTAGILMLSIVSLPAQEEDFSISDDLDSLFEEDIITEEEEDGAEDAAAGETVEAGPEQMFLVAEKLEWGGSIDASTSTLFIWNDYMNGISLFTPDARSFEPSLRGSLFFDARPENNFRVFGKFKTRLPLSQEALSPDILGLLSGGTAPETGLFGLPQPVSVPNIQIFELFSDFNWRDRVFFRMGKQTIKWGVGYFFSPADVVNLQGIDPFDATAEREGPIALRAQAPIGINNLYLYTIFTPAGVDEVEQIEDVALAPKFEFLVGNTELGIGGFIQSDLSPKAILTGTSAVGNIDFFGEAVLSIGSDRVFLVEGSSGSDTLYDIREGSDTTPYFSGTLGFIYLNSVQNLTLYGQYLFNGDGYSDAEFLRQLRRNVAEDPATLSSSNRIAELAGIFSNSGRHYTALSIGKSELFNTDLGANLIWVANWSDLSGIVRPELSWQLFDHAYLSAGLSFTYGESGSEYTLGFSDTGINLERSVSLTLQAKLGSGVF